MQTPTYQVGDLIGYQPFNATTPRRVKVTAKLDDVKNGLPGFHGIVQGGIEDGGLVWGYDDQIV